MDCRLFWFEDIRLCSPSGAFGLHRSFLNFAFPESVYWVLWTSTICNVLYNMLPVFDPYPSIPPGVMFFWSFYLDVANWIGFVMFLSLMVIVSSHGLLPSLPVTFFCVIWKSQILLIGSTVFSLVNISRNILLFTVLWIVWNQVILWAQSCFVVVLTGLFS